MLLEQVQFTAALVLVYLGFGLWIWPNENKDEDNPAGAWVAFTFFVTSCALFFITTLMRIWL